MRKFFTVIARIIAAIFAILFVITTILALLLTALNMQIFNAKLYKNVLAEQRIYARLPEIVGMALTNSYFKNPCANNQLACNIDGASPELEACLTTALGSSAYQAIGSSQRKPTDAELQLAKPCLEKYGSLQSANPQPGSGGSSGFPAFMQNLTAANWQAIITILLPPDNLRLMTESTLDQLFAYLNGETNTVTVPLDKLKQTLTSPAGSDLILQLLDSQPPCTGQELAQITTGTSTDGIVLCKPPESVLPNLIPQLKDLLDSVIPQIPDKAVIIKPPAAGVPPSGTGPFGADPITTIRTVRLVMRLSVLVPLAFLLLVTVFAVRSFKSWMRWWGIPFFICGTIVIGMGVSSLLALNTAWTKFIIPRIPPYIPPDIASIGQELVRSIVRILSGAMILPAAILFVMGLVAWIGSYFIKTKNNPTIPVDPPTPAS